MHLDRAGSIGLVLEPLVFTLWPSLLSPLFQHRFFSDFKLSQDPPKPVNLGCTGTESIQKNANRVFFISAPLCLFGWLVVFVCVCLLVFWHLGAYFGVVVAL